jgi:hypothetical protein
MSETCDALARRSPMTDEQKRIIELTRALGEALGALECIKISSYDFNRDGLDLVIARLRKAAGYVD